MVLLVTRAVEGELVVLVRGTQISYRLTLHAHAHTRAHMHTRTRSPMTQ